MAEVGNPLIVEEVTPVPESCSDCSVANEQYENAVKLKQIAEYIYSIATDYAKPRDINEMIEPNEDLVATLQQAINEFFPGIGALDMSSRDNLRFLADINYETITAFIEHINRTINKYEQLIDSCAGQGLKKIALHRSKKKAIVELTICNGEVTITRDSKKSVSHPITVTAQKLEPNNNVN